MDKISQRNQNKRNERKIKQFHDKRFDTSKEEDKKMEINKNKQNPFRTKDIVMEDNTDNQEKQNESIWWNVCKNIINLKEWREQFKSLKLTENLMEEYNDHKQKIDHLINEIKRIKEQRIKIQRKDLNSSILLDRDNKRRGRVVVKDNEKTYIYHIIKTKTNFIMIYLKGKLVNFKNFYLKFKDEGLVKGKYDIIREIKFFNEIKRRNMEEYRKRNGIPSNSYSKK